jgi:hypothetical protein
MRISAVSGVPDQGVEAPNHTCQDGGASTRRSPPVSLCRDVPGSHPRLPPRLPGNPSVPINPSPQLADTPWVALFVLDGRSFHVPALNVDRRVGLVQVDLLLPAQTDLFGLTPTQANQILEYICNQFRNSHQQLSDTSILMFRTPEYRAIGDRRLMGWVPYWRDDH